VTLLETLRDLPLHSVAHTFVAVLLQIRQQHQSRKQLSTTHQRNLRHAAVALQTLSNQTTARISQLVVRLRLTSLHVPLTRITHNSTSRIQAQRHSFPPPPPIQLSHIPLLTKLIFFRRLNRPRLAHSG
jgi:hypothetical protein